MDVWLTIGFTYSKWSGKYCLIKEEEGDELCLACTGKLKPKINVFCYECKAPRAVDWTTGNKSLDSFIMESWSNTEKVYDAYLQWIEYSLLTNVQEMTLLRHGCTHTAEWLERNTDELTRVTLKKIVVDEQSDHSFDFYQVIISRVNDAIDKCVSRV